MVDSFEDAVVATLGRVLVFPRFAHIDIAQSRCQFRPVLADIPVGTFEPAAIFYPVAARHEHDVIGLAVRL